MGQKVVNLQVVVHYLGSLRWLARCKRAGPLLSIGGRVAATIIHHCKGEDFSLLCHSPGHLATEDNIRLVSSIVLAVVASLGLQYKFLSRQPLRFDIPTPTRPHNGYQRESIIFAPSLQ